MTDAAATITAFAAGLGVLAGYGCWLFVRLARARARLRPPGPPGTSVPKSAVSTELKPRGPVGTSAGGSIKTS